MTAPQPFIERVSRGLDDATRAVLDVAFARPEFGPEAFARVTTAYYGAHAAVVDQIATDLYAALDLRTDDPRQVLTRLYGSTSLLYPDRVADMRAEERETDAVRAAQLVASLIVRGVAA